MYRKLAAVVVTYNRKQLLQRCINALLAQTVPLDRIFIIDNASTDGTEALLASPFYRNEPHIECVRLPENIGGAGGFADGMRRAYDWGADHMWIMDDDAIPEASALESLLPHVAAGVIPVSTQVDRHERMYGAFGKVVPIAKVLSLKSGFGVTKSNALTFVGPLISRACIEHIGLPRSDFFISFDDLEYSLRATSNGFTIVLVEGSKILHECAGGTIYKRFLWITRPRPMNPNWRYYYDTRNNITVLKGYSNNRVSLMASALRLLFRKIAGDVMFNPRQAGRRAAYRVHGTVDGFYGRLGKRVRPR